MKRLVQISTPKTFKENEYICFEGQPGKEMYIILRGSVGIYVNSAIGTLTEASRIMTGDFFGEMSIFDNLPRSASCVALEDTICVAIDKEKLPAFLANCPDLATRLLENMSGRIRRLDNELYKTERFTQNMKVEKFAIPNEYSFSHEVEVPALNPAFVEMMSADCPVCGKKIEVPNLKKQIMSVRKIDSDGRIFYAECEPLWNDVWQCPHCRYSNHNLSFFRMIPFKRERIKKLLKEQHKPAIEKADFLETPFDMLFVKYIQAIHINEAVNMNDNLLIGKLWLDLYWLFCDAADERMARYCSEKAAARLKKAVDNDEISDDYSKQSFALSLANLLSQNGQTEEAVRMCEIAESGSDKQLKAYAIKLNEQLMTSRAK